MIFIATVRGFGIPCELLGIINKSGTFKVLPDKNYFYQSEPIKTDIYDNIGSCICQAVDIIEKDADTFRKMVGAGGNVELYITYHNETTQGLVIDASIVKRLADIGISLDIECRRAAKIAE